MVVPVLPLFVPGRHDPVEDQRPLLAAAGLGHGLQEGVAQGDGEPPAVLVHLGLGDGALGVQQQLQALGRPGPGSVVGGSTALVRGPALTSETSETTIAGCVRLCPKDNLKDVFLSQIQPTDN